MTTQSEPGHGRPDPSLSAIMRERRQLINLHQFVAGRGTAAVGYGSLLGDGVRLLVDAAARIDTDTRTVQLASGRKLDYDDGRVLPSAVTIWTAGFRVPELARVSGLRTDPLGRLLTDETLTSIDDDRVVAAGDAAALSGQPLRMSCQAAGPMGAPAANTVLSRIAGEQPAKINQAFAGSCISLGRRTGIFQVARRDDTPLNILIAGRVGAAIKEAICKSTLWGSAARPPNPARSTG